MRSARPRRVNTRSPSGISILARRFGLERLDQGAPPRLPACEPMRDALEAWPPERPRLGIIVERGEMPGADLDQRRGGIGRQRRGKGLGELAERTVDDDAAVGSARWQVDGVELAQFENMLGIDGVRVAQPAFDLRDRERCRPRGTRRPRRGLVHALDLGGMVERPRPGEIGPALLACLLPPVLRRRLRPTAGRSAIPPLEYRRAWPDRRG